MKFTCKPQVKRPSQNLFADIPSLKPLPNNPDLFITHTPRSFPALSRATEPAYIVCLPVNLLSLLEDGGCRHSWSLRNAGLLLEKSRAKRADLARAGQEIEKSLDPLRLKLARSPMSRKKKNSNSYARVSTYKNLRSDCIV